MTYSLYIRRNNPGTPAKRYSLMILRIGGYETEYETMFSFDYEKADKLNKGGIPYKDGHTPSWEDIEEDRLLKEKEELTKKLAEINEKLSLK